jgi:hypothetical protein
MENKSKQNKKKFQKLRISDLLIPFVSGVIFLIVIIFVLVPSIRGSREMLVEIERVKSDQKSLSKNKDVLDDIDFSNLQKDLMNARRVLPAKLEVAQFASYVLSLAAEKNLRDCEIKATDIMVAVEETVMLNMKGIRVPIGCRGDYNSITDFFDDLQVASPYVISFGTKVELTKTLGTSVEEEIWSLGIDVTGYYVEEPQASEDELNVYRPIVPYDRHAEIIKEFDERVKKLVD